MARQEVPKEDLVRDAKAFAVRVEFRRSEHDPNWIFVGLREEGGGSVYFGDDEFYAFNSANEMRRAFVDGRLLKAENRRLIALRRERSEDKSVLAATELSGEEQGDLLRRFEQSAAAELLRDIEAEAFAAVRTAGEPASDVARVREWLVALTGEPIVVAQRPNAD